VVQSEPAAQAAQSDPGAQQAPPVNTDSSVGSNFVSPLIQLGASYSANGAQFNGSGTTFNVGSGSFGRGSNLTPVSSTYADIPGGAQFSSTGISESFQPNSTGIEQTFQIAESPSGSGDLLIDVPVSGLTIIAAGTNIDFENTNDMVVATYSGLKVTDASGNSVPATMSPSQDGTGIVLDIDDADAIYPLTVDPVWMGVEIGVGPTPGRPAGWSYGTSVSISGTTAVVGSPTAFGYDYEGAPYQDPTVDAYTESDTGWERYLSLALPSDLDLDTNPEFGYSVAISGTTIAVGAYADNSSAGAVYIYSATDGDELYEIDGTSDSEFGYSVALSGSTLVVGAPGIPSGAYGEAYVYTGSGSSWSSGTEISPAAPTAGDGFGDSVAASDSTVVVGAPFAPEGPCPGVDCIVDAGEVDVYNGSGSSWSESQSLVAPDLDSYYLFGSAVSISGTNIAVESPGADYYGEAWVYGYSDSTWSNTAVLPQTNVPSSDNNAGSISISGSTLMVGDADEELEEPSDTPTGAATIYLLGSSGWTSSAVLEGPYGGDGFGRSVAISSTGTVIGAPSDFYDRGQGDAMFYGDAALITPSLSSDYSNELIAEGSPSDPCNCGSTPAQRSVGDPVDTATGDLYESSTDLSLPGAGIPLQFTRTYDALAVQHQLFGGSGSPEPPLGYGWTDNFDMNVSCDVYTGDATVTEENGAQVVFSPPSESSSLWCDGAQSLVAPGPRIASTLTLNSDGTWTYVRLTGTEETFTFSSGGALTSISDVNGDSWDTISESTYSPTGGQTSCPSGDSCQAWTSSDSGRELVLATNSSGNLVEVFDANDSSLYATFTYGNGTPCSSWSGSEDPDLCTVTDPGDVTSTYGYDSSNAHAYFDYDLTSSTAPGASGQTDNTYYSDGQIETQTDADGNVTTFCYDSSGSTCYDNSASTDGGGTTIIEQYPDGESGGVEDVTLDQYSNYQLVAETTGYGTSAASTTIYPRDPSSTKPAQVIDGDGNVTTYLYQTSSGPGGTPTSSGNVLLETNGAGDTTENAYNSDNQVYCAIDAADYANFLAGNPTLSPPLFCPSSPPSPTSIPTAGGSDSYAGMTIGFYNSADQLVATTDALGNTSTYSYTGSGLSVPEGLLFCTVGPVAYQASISCPSGYGGTYVARTTTAAYDAAGDKTSTTNADGDTTTYTYVASPAQPGEIATMTDPSGTTTTYSYNAAGQITEKTEAFSSYSASTIYSYDAYERLVCEVAPLDVANGVTCHSSPTAGATYYVYDADGNVTSTTNPLGGTTQIAYDGLGLSYCTVEPSQYALGTRCPSSEPTTPPTVGSDSYLGATITTYDANGRVIQMTNPLGGLSLDTYDGANNVLANTVESNNATADPNVVTTYTYDADNRVVSATVDSGSSLAATNLTSYDPNGDVYCTVSPNAVTSGSSTYQCPPWQTSWIVTPPSPVSLYSSSPSSSQANNVTTDFFNADGTLVQDTNPNVDTTINVVNGDGDSYCSADPTNVATYLTAHSSATYPYLCPTTPPTTPPSSGSNPGYSTTIFDATGNALSSTDPVGDTTTYTYDAAGESLTTTDPRGMVTTNCYYDENGTGACANGAPAAGGSGDDLYSTTTPVTTADPSGETTSYTYFPGDQVDTTTTPASTATSAYDDAGDLTSTTYSGINSSYSAPTNPSDTYNVDGSVNTMTDATGTTTYGYDAMGDVTSQALVAGSGTGLANASTSYEYFSTGVLEQLTYPAYSGHSTPAVTYTYDATGAISSSTDWLGNEETYSHDSDGNETGQDNDVSTTHTSGTSSTAFSYDGADNLTSAVSTMNQTCGGAEALTQSFSGSSGSRNPDGQLTEATDSYASSCSSQGSLERNYDYDLGGRVTYQGSTGSSSSNFVYDNSGDPTTISSHAGTGNFDTYSQTFDNAGEVTAQTPTGSSGATSAFTYDTLGDQKVDSSTLTTTYGFNATGQMTSETSPIGVTTYLYNGDGLEASTATPGKKAWSVGVGVDAARGFANLTCVSASFCVAVDSGGYLLTFNGTTWSTPIHVDGTNSLSDVSCTSTTFCVAVDDVGDFTRYNGTSWSTPVDVDAGRWINGVTCTSTTFCMAWDSNYVLTYNGTSWSTPTEIDSTRALQDISCANSTFCMAVDGSGYALKYTGSWSSASDIDSTRSIYSVVCTSTNFCMSVDGSGYAVKYSGSWATPSHIDGSNALYVACTSSTFCAAVDSSGNALNFNGTSWSTATEIDEYNTFDVVTCATPSFCVAADEAGNDFTFSGTTWSTATNYNVAGADVWISCPVANFCVGANTSGYANTFASVTQTWYPPTDVDSSRSLYALACPTASFCVGVGSLGYVTTYNGSSWTTAADADGSRTLDAVSCVSSSFCWAVDTSGYAIKYNGSSWSTPANINASHSINSVSCTSTSFCAAVGASGYVTTYNGTSWATAANKDASRTLDSVSCVSSSFCWAVDATGYALKYTGSWSSSPTNVDSSRDLVQVDCTSTSFCMAVDSSGYDTYYSGSSWSTASNVDSSHGFTAVTCTSSTFCMAVDTWGYAVHFNGSSWSSPVSVDPSSYAGFDAISCTSSTFCVAVDNYGAVFSYNGSTWSTTESIDPGQMISAVSCTTTTTCVAVDESGNGMVYAPVAGTSTQLTWDTNEQLPTVLSDGTYDYLYGPGSTPVEEINLATSTPTFLTYTPSDSTWVTTNAAGDETSFYGYDAFGNLAFGSPTSAFGYAGQYTDATSGLSNLRARFYDAQTGSFTSRDPAFGETDTAYSYAGDDPVNGGDPFGLCNSTGPNGIFLFSGACPTTSAQSQADGRMLHAQVTGTHFDFMQGLRSVADYGAAVANGIVSTVTFGHVHVAEPYCNVAGWVDDLGDVIGGAVGLVGGAIVGGEVIGAVGDFLGSAAEGDAGLLRVSGPEGSGPSLPMNWDSINAVSEKYGIDLSDNEVGIDSSIAGLRGSTAEDGSITLYRGAFENEETLAKTLVHEQFHVGQLADGMPYPSAYDPNSPFETAAEEYAQQWWQSQQ
jgi:RHS repeat-associated protein